MHRGHKVVACIPAGRKRQMSILLKHLRSQMGLLDGVMLWVNTHDIDDLKFIFSQADDFVCPVMLDPWAPPHIPKQLNTGRFYRNCTDEKTVYIRFDDDVVWMRPDAIEKLVDARLDNRAPFVVFANIWNNAVISHIQQQKGNIGQEFGEITKYCLDDVGWNNPEFGVYVHRILQDHIERGTTGKLLFGNHPLDDYLRFSVSCFAWGGWDWAKFEGDITKNWARFEKRHPPEEEMWISELYVREIKRPNTICGDALVAHYSFFSQRPELDKTDILDKYRHLADEAYHNRYYELMELREKKGWTAFKVTPWWERPDRLRPEEQEKIREYAEMRFRNEKLYV